MSTVTKKLLEDIFLEVKEVKKIEQENKKIAQNTEKIAQRIEKIQQERLIKEDSNEELLHLILQQLNDLGVKKDLEINMMALKNDSAKPSKKKSTGTTSEKKKMNIMAYFKFKYTEDPESIYDITSKEEIEAVLNTHETELKSKKKGNLEQAKATFIYRDLISGNKLKQTRLRTKKEQEEESETVLQEEIVEYDVVEEKQEREDNLVDEYESDSEEDDD